MRIQAAVATAALGALGTTITQAATFSNILGDAVEFPAGSISFADELVAFAPGLVFDPSRNAFTPLPPYRGGQNVLGSPDMDLLQSVACFDGSPTVEDCKFASLGEGGILTVRFTDNVLTGSGNANPDLWIFEAGPADLTYVDVSIDGQIWLSLGSIDGTRGVDIDAFGYGTNAAFTFVRLRDAPGGQTSGDTLGADIDAIGAISTQAVVPLPATAPLFGSALGLLAAGARPRRNRAWGG